MDSIKEEELLNPKHDFVFKKIFGEHEKIFISFAESVLYNGEHKIKSATFLDGTTRKERMTDKECRFDVLAVLDDGSRVNLEIQLQTTREYERRSLYYWCKLYEKQLNAGQNYLDLRPAICINVLDFDFFKGKPDFHTVLGVTNLKDQSRYCHDFEIHYIEIPKAPKEISNLLGKWLYFLNDPSLEKLEEVTMQEPIIAEAAKILKSLSHDPEVVAVYESRRKYLLDYNTDLTGARLDGIAEGIEKGKAQGITEGIEKGMEKGMEKGIEKGIEKGKAETALHLKRLGVAPEVIAQATGFSMEEIKKLEKESSPQSDRDKKINFDGWER